MAKTKFILVVLFMFATSSAHAVYKEQIAAAQILRVAAARVPSGLQMTFLKMANILDNATILIAPEGTEFTRCGESTLAYVVPALSRSIHLCRLGTTRPATEIAQTLIHEAAHLVGYMNECDASTFEAAAMIQSGLGLSYRNGYMDRCGL
jgi:hypothetical protein